MDDTTVVEAEPEVVDSDTQPQLDEHQPDVAPDQDKAPEQDVAPNFPENINSEEGWLD